MPHLTRPSDTDASHVLPDDLDLARVNREMEKLVRFDRPRLARWWAYFRNPTRPASVDVTAGGGQSDRPYRQAQEWGLPTRITGLSRSTTDVFSGQAVEGVARKEVVIENDIGWRVETMVDYLFGKPIVIESSTPDPVRREIIGTLLREIIALNGGIVLLQQLATLGGVFGFVDVLVKFDPTRADDQPCTGMRAVGQPPVCDQKKAEKQAETTVINEPTDPADKPADSLPGLVTPPPDAGTAPGETASSNTDTGASQTSRSSASTELPLLRRMARMIRLEVVHPARALPLLSHSDWQRVDAYATVTPIVEDTINPLPDQSQSTLVQDSVVARLARFTRSLAPRRAARDTLSTRDTIELITPSRWFRFGASGPVASGRNTLGRLGLVHIQNTAVPFSYAGLSDVEPLLPLQDELNTRLSDRAHRITMQSFKMYLGRGIDNFNQMPISPGRMWSTDNENANVIEFGGDSACPSEDAHLSDLREAMDKASGVTPIAAGAIKGRIGRLTSAAALRVTMLALLSRTEKKRTTYGKGIEQMCELALAWLDHAGLFHTTPAEREVEIHWPNPLPVNEMERLDEARAKLALGVSAQVVLRELGY